MSRLVELVDLFQQQHSKHERSPFYLRSHEVNELKARAIPTVQPHRYIPNRMYIGQRARAAVAR